MTNIRVKPSQRGYCICYSNRLNKYTQKKRDNKRSLMMKKKLVLIYLSHIVDTNESRLMGCLLRTQIISLFFHMLG